MAQRIIDVFETIQIQKDHGNRSVLATSQGNRLSDPVVEQQAIGQICDSIVVRGVRHFKRHGPRCAHVVKNDHSSDHAACPVMDRRGGIFNGGFKSVAADENAIRGESDRFVLFDGHLHGIASGLVRAAVNNSEDFGQRFASGFFTEPPGHLFCNDIQIRDIPGNIGT